VENKRLDRPSKLLASVNNVGETGSEVILEHTGHSPPTRSLANIGTIEKCHSELSGVKNVPVGWCH
jgi:hypothetical protein